LTLPLKVAPWLSVALSAGGRGTWWGESVPVTRVDPVTLLPTRVCDSGEVAAGEQYCGETLTRTVGSGAVQVVGPSFSRIFDVSGKRFGKLKHVVEPRFEYVYASDFDDQNRVARFDEIDAATAANSVRAALVNRVLAKPASDELGAAFEILSFELAQLYSLDDEKPLQRSSDGQLTKKEGPILAQLRFSPARVFDLQARASWSTLFDSLNSTSLSMRGKGKRVGLDLTWYTDYNAQTGEQRSDQARVGLDLQIVPQRLSLTAQVNYDLKDAELLQHRYFLNYRSQCWSVLVEYREQLTTRFETQDYRFMLSLKNVGTFLDLNGGDRSDRY
ncbi:MAG: LPS assembly protein LptD, partial [Myxococcota bacterium]